MARVHVFHNLDDLAEDCRQVAVMEAREGTKIVQRNAQKGAKLARANATRTAGAHGKHYPSSITMRSLGPKEAEYGPRPGHRQGGMSFEHGSRNQPPHLDLAKSADVIGAQGTFGNDVSRMLDDLFWPS